MTPRFPTYRNPRRAREAGAAMAWRQDQTTVIWVSPLGSFQVYPLGDSPPDGWEPAAKFIPGKTQVLDPDYR